MGEAAGAVGRLRSRVWMFMNNPIRVGMLASSRLARERGSAALLRRASSTESTRSPRDINFLSIVEAIEGSLESAEVEGSGVDEPRDAARPTRPELLWVELVRRSSSAPAETTLEDVCGDATREAVRHSTAKAHAERT
jgi:hypothetical protein